MNDQSTPDDAPTQGIQRPDDPEYQDSMHDTIVTQRLADWAEEHLGRADCTTFLVMLKYAYEGIRPEGPHANDWAMDIN